MLRRGKLCDVVVKCGDAEVRGHRLVLAAASEYFRACLTGVSQKSVGVTCVGWLAD